jgi:predicted Zn-dependent protease
MKRIFANDYSWQTLQNSTLFLILLTFAIIGHTNNKESQTKSNLLTLPKKAETSISPQFSLPDFKNAKNTISEKEKQAGRRFFISVQRFSTLIDDLIIQQYIHNLGNLLVNHANIINPHYIFFVLNEASINAFAGPAGYTGIHAGLILSASSEGMLASVLAHEIAHTKQRHLHRFIANQKSSAYANPLVIFGLILAGIVTDTPEVFPGIIALQGKHIEESLKFLRHFENEADQAGLTILTSAGFSGQYAALFMDKLLNNDFSLDSSEYLRTHPLTKKRLANLQNQITDKTLYAPKSEFDLIQARISYVTQIPTEKKLTSHQQDYITLLSLIANNEHLKALNYWQKLPTQTKENSLLFNLLYMHLLLNTNQLTKAEKHLIKLRQFHPFHLEVLNLQSQLYLKQNNPKQAEKILLKRTNDNVNLYQKHLWKLLGNLYFNRKENAKLFYAKAREYYTLGLLRKALENLENAIKSAQQEGQKSNEIRKLKETYNHWHKQFYTGSHQNIESPHKYQ